MRARRREANFQNIVNAPSCVEHGAPAALPMGIDQVAHRCNHIRLRECLQHKRALPQVIFRKRPVLEGAAAAGAKMLAHGFAAFVAGFFDAQKMTAVGVAFDWLDRDDFTRQCVGNVDRPICGVGDPVSPMSEPHDTELFSHASPRAGTRHCHYRRRRARG